MVIYLDNLYTAYHTPTNMLSTTIKIIQQSTDESSA